MAITLSYTFTANTTIQSAQVNANFTTLSTRALDKTGDTMTGDLKFTDATYDIGKSAATRPRDLFLSRNATVGGTLSVVGASDFTGVMTLTGGQLAFPSTQAASSGVNTLDDYEEGTWTPSFVSSGGGTPTYTTQVGWYVKVGKVVHFWGRLTLATFGSLAAGTITVAGFPFTAENTTDEFGFVHVPFWVGLTTALVNLGGVINPNGTAADMRTTGAAGGLTTNQLTKADMNSTTGIIFGGSYRASA